jgi:hypothetical protein
LVHLTAPCSVGVLMAIPSIIRLTKSLRGTYIASSVTKIISSKMLAQMVSFLLSAFYFSQNLYFKSFEVSQNITD